MNSYESQFRAIVGGEHKPSDELDGDQARALSALIFGMPETQISRDGFFIQYEGWSLDQDIYLAVTVTDDHKSGTQALCEPNLALDHALDMDS